MIHERATASTPWWPPNIVPPKGAPNVLLIITDDVGFGAPSTFGGVIPTPSLDRIAKMGLPYSRVVRLNQIEKDGQPVRLTDPPGIGVAMPSSASPFGQIQPFSGTRSVVGQQCPWRSARLRPQSYPCGPSRLALLAPCPLA